MTTQPLARYGAPNGALASGLTTSVTPRPGTQPDHPFVNMLRGQGRCVADIYGQMKMSIEFNSPQNVSCVEDDPETYTCVFDVSMSFVQRSGNFILDNMMSGAMTTPIRPVTAKLARDDRQWTVLWWE